MTNYAARGNRRDVKVTDYLEGGGFTVGSRRHIPGPGDLLAVKYVALGEHEVLLLEVKSTTRPYHTFGPEDRRALSQLARSLGARAVLAWWPPRGVLGLIYEEAWPS